MKFVDTSFWVSLAREAERHHHEASLLYQSNREALLTTNLVLGETWTLLRKRAGHRAATTFLNAMEASPRLEIAVVDEGCDRDAWAWLQRHDERIYSYADATSFSLMRARGIDSAFAFDGDFSAAGFIEVRI